MTHKNHQRSSARIFLASLAFMALAAGAHGATLNVANNGVDSGACGAAATPCRSISQAIINASAGDEIVVGPGRYGDLNSDSIIGSGGDEQGAPGCACLIAVNKAVVIRSTHGAAATLIDARSVYVSAAVLITANGGEFGRPGQGFTVTYPLDNTDQYPAGINVLSDNSTDISVRGNQVVGSLQGRGIGINTVCNSGVVRIEDNQVIGWSIGINPTCGNKTVNRNAMLFNEYGLSTYNSGPVTDNIALGNANTGLFFNNANASGNIAAGNNFGFQSTGGSSLSGNAALGNLVGFDAYATSGTLTGNNVIGNQCGVKNDGVSGGVIATNNYWGAASGPGPDPADNVCAGTVAVTPFAATPFNVANPLPAPSVYRIHAGGASYTSSHGTHWIADSYFNTPGTTVTTAAAIANTTDAPLYQTQRTDPAAAPELRYTIAVANGTYTVKLLFAEIVATAAGQRVFNVKLDGTAVLTNFDIFAAAGAANKAIAKAFTVTTTNGTLTIDFVHVTGDPLLAAIEVLPQ